MRTIKLHKASTSFCNRFMYLEESRSEIVTSDSSSKICTFSTAVNLKTPSFSLCWITSKSVSFHKRSSLSIDCSRLCSYVAVTLMCTISSYLSAACQEISWPRENSFYSRSTWFSKLRIALISVQWCSFKSKLPIACTIGIVSLKSKTMFLNLATAVESDGRLRSHCLTIL